MSLKGDNKHTNFLPDFPVINHTVPDVGRRFRLACVVTVAKLIPG